MVSGGVPGGDPTFGGRPTAPGPGGRGGLRLTVVQALLPVRRWPPRRWITALVLVGPLLVLYVAVGPAPSVLWALPVDVVSAALAGLIVASYVPEPRSGRLLEVGCSPCAVVAAAAIVGSLVMRDTSPGDAGIALLAVVMLGFGLAQRLAGGGTCTLPAPALSTGHGGGESR